MILWKQCHALVHDRGFPAQIEASHAHPAKRSSGSALTFSLQNVVRDLWALRLETFSSKIDYRSEGESEPEVFSSQAADTSDESDKVFKPQGKRVQWPRLIDSIALCYMGALLMRFPVSIGDVYR